MANEAEEPGSPDPHSTVSAIHIHEDDWGMRNLYPLAAFEDVAADLKAAMVASEKNRDPSGYGWWGIHLIQQPAVKFDDVGLTIADAAKALSRFLPRVKRFYATIGSAIGREEKDPWGSYNDDAWCYGLGPHCYIKLDTDGELVSSIWFDFSTTDETDLAVFKQAIQAIDQLVPSLIADYFMDALFVVSDTGTLDRYIASRKEHMEDLTRRINAAREGDD